MILKLKLSTDIDKPYDLMRTIIIENKYKFVNLFMDYGIQINWTRTTIDKLVQETVNNILNFILQFKYLLYLDGKKLAS